MLGPKHKYVLMQKKNIIVNFDTGLPVAGAAAYFFADCECEGKAYAVSSSSPSLSAPSSRSGTIKSGKNGRKSGRRQRRASEATFSIAEVKKV